MPSIREGNDVTLGQLLNGFGSCIIIGARENLDAFPINAGTRFVDTNDLATLRARQPALRCTALAPIDLLDPSGTLAEIGSGDMDFVIDWTVVRDPDHAAHRVDTAARVLRPGGLLLLPALDPDVVRPEPDRTSDAFARFAMVSATLAVDHAADFGLVSVVRHGYYHLASLRRHGDGIVKTDMAR